MKSLASLALLVAFAVPAVAQVADAGKDPAKDATNAGDTTELKKRFQGARPPAAPPPSEPVAGKVPQEADPGLSIAELVALLPDCKINSEDASDLADKLKGKYAIVNCIGGPVVLVPRTKIFKHQQLEFPGIRRARFIDHYMLLQFDGAVQYQDLLKQNDKGYVLAGYVDTVEKTAGQFDDVVPFVDALKNFMGLTGADQGAFASVPARVKAHAGDGPYRLTGAFVGGKGKKEFRVNLATGGRTDMIWPKDAWPSDK